MKNYLYKNIKDYFVDDLIDSDTQIVFVLESPHNEEVKRGYPVAGKSGKDMSKVLFGIDESLGKLIYEKKIKNLGIINVSNYPLQMSAYEDETLEADMEFFEKIRQNPSLRKKQAPINSAISKVMDSFKSRLAPHKDKKIILCGTFAQNAFDGVFNELSFKEVLRVPHPSFNQWLRASNKEVITKLEEFVS